MKPARRNIEIKAACPDLPAARRAAKKLGARFDCILHQVDTYFHVSNGRLKLREIRGEQAELIWYDRPNRASARDSRYRLIPIPDAAQLKAALAAALGVRSVVRKRRELWRYHNIRIHLDRVRGLGSFIEYEAVITRADQVRLSHRRLDALCSVMKVDATSRIAGSYGEMI